MFSNEFTPFFEVQYLLKLYGLRKMGVKSSKRFPNIVEEAHREWLTDQIFLFILTNLVYRYFYEDCSNRR